MKVPYHVILSVACGLGAVHYRASRRPMCCLCRWRSSAEYQHRQERDCCTSNLFRCRISQKESNQIHPSTTAGSYAYLKIRLCFLSASQGACLTDSLTAKLFLWCHPEYAPYVTCFPLWKGYPS